MCIFIITSVILQITYQTRLNSRNREIGRLYNVPEGVARSFLYILFGCFRSNPGVKRTLDEMKEDEERIKEVTKAREMKKAMNKKKVKARNGSLACFVVTKLLYSWKSHCTEWPMFSVELKIKRLKAHDHY